MDIYLGRHLRELKKDIGLKEEELADSLCISQGTLNKYLNDKLPTPFDFVINILKKNREAGTKLAVKWKEAFEQEFINALLA